MTTAIFTSLKRWLIVLFIAAQLPVAAQVQSVTMDEAIQAALAQNALLRSTEAEIKSQEFMKRTSVDIPKTSLMFMSGQYNSLNQDNNLTITQNLPFPTVFTSSSKLHNLKVENSQHRRAMTKNELVFQLKQIGETLQYLHAREALLMRQDSLFAELVRISSLQQATGEGTLLQRTSAETRYNEVRNQYRQNQADLLSFNSQLAVLMNAQGQVSLIVQPFGPITTTLLNDTAEIASNPQLAYQRSLNAIALQEKRVESNRALPDLTVGYFNQTLIGFQQQLDGTDRYFSNKDRFSGFMVGVALPIWFVPAHGRIKSAAYRSEATHLQSMQVERQLHGEWAKAVQQFEKHRNSLAYYTQSALPNAELLLRQSTLSYRTGEISQAEYRLNLQQAVTIQEAYIQTVLQYNLSIITLEFLAGSYSKN